MVDDLPVVGHDEPVDEVDCVAHVVGHDAQVAAELGKRAVAPGHDRVVLGELASGRANARIHLEPLSSSAVARLAEPYAADPVELYARTGGNPFFVTEALAAGGPLESLGSLTALAFDKTSLDAPAGSVTIELTNDSSVPHNVEVEGNGAVTVVDADGLQFSSMAQVDGDAPVCMLGVQLHILAAGASFNLETRRASAGALATVKE